MKIYVEKNSQRAFSSEKEYDEFLSEIFPEMPSKEPEGIIVRVRKNDVNTAMKILKKKMIREGILKDLRKKEYYITGTEKRKREKLEAKIRWRKKKRQLEKEFN